MNGVKTKKWLRRILRLPESTPYRKLTMGFVRAYSIIIPKSQRDQFIGDGWIEAADFRDFHYQPDDSETVMLSKPYTLPEVDRSSLIGQTITAYKMHYGSYGMGGPGFLGITLSNQPEARKVMVYAVWGASQYTLLDNRELQCHPRYYDTRHPWLSAFANEDVPNWDELTPVLIGCRIDRVELNQRRLALHLRKGEETHLLEFLANDERLPLFGNGDARKDAFESGVISDYILFQHPDAVLWT